MIQFKNVIYRLSDELFSLFFTVNSKVTVKKHQKKGESSCFCINICALLNKVFSFHNLLCFHYVIDCNEWDYCVTRCCAVG